MDWEYVKDKILVFGDDDWIFSDMFISIVGAYEGCFNDEDRMLYTYKMLREIMSDNLIDIYFIKPNENLAPFIYNNAQDIDYFISKIDVEWKKQNYKLPDPDQLFWATTNSNGKSQIH